MSALVLAIVAASASSIFAKPIDANANKCPVTCWGEYGCSNSRMTVLGCFLRSESCLLVQYYRWH